MRKQNATTGPSVKDIGPPTTTAIPLLLGLDFDLTLTTQRIYGRRDFDRLPHLFGGPDRIAALQRFFRFLHSPDAMRLLNDDDDHHRRRRVPISMRIVILTWNFRDIVREALERVGLFEYVDEIYDRVDVVRAGGYRVGKARLMSELLIAEQRRRRCCGMSSEDATERDDGCSDAVFVDDSREVIAATKQRLKPPACAAHLVPTLPGKKEAVGMSVADLRAVARLLGLEYEG